MRDIVALPIQTVQGLGDLITSTAANAPARLPFPTTPSGQVLGSQGASVGVSVHAYGRPVPHLHAHHAGRKHRQR